MAKLTLSDVGNMSNESTFVATINNNNTAIENALENTLSRDGTLPNMMTADLDMNSKRILNLPLAVSNAEPIRKAEFDALQRGDLVFPLTVSEGGTGLTTLVDNGVLIGNGTSAIDVTAAGVQGSTFTARGGLNPIFTLGVVNLKSYAGVGLGNAAVDTAALQAAYDDTTIGTIYLPKGEYILSTTGVTMKANKRLVGDGMGFTVIKVVANPAAGTDPMFCNNQSNLIFEDLTFDYNGFGTVMNGQYPGLRAFVYIIGGSRISFLRCEFKGMYNAGLMTNTSNTVVVKDCIIKRDTTSNGPTSAGNYGISVAGTGTVDASNAYDCLIDGNLVINTSIGVSVRDSTISNNIVKGAGFGAGIHTQALASNYNVRIVNNTVFDSGTAQDLAGAYPGGIENWAHSSVISGNVCFRNGACGINAGGKNSVYANNVCYNNGLSLVAGSAGIAAFAQDATFHAGGSIFIGNKCYDDQATKTQEYGYLEHPNLITFGVTNITLGANEFTGNELGDTLLQNVSRGGHMLGNFKLTGGFVGGSHTNLSTLSLNNNGFHHFIATGGTQTANRTLTINLNNIDRTLSLNGNLTLAHNFSTIGGFVVDLTATGTTNVTLPTTGTLATLAGTETFTNKTLTSPTINTPTITGGTANALTSLSINNGGFQQSIAATGAITANRAFSINLQDGARTLSLGNNVTFNQAFTLTGGHTTTFTTTNATSLTLPTTGTLAVEDNTAWTTYTPTVTAGSGTWTSGTASGAYKIIGKTVFLKLRYEVTTAGTATGSIIWSLPFTLKENNQVINGVEYQLNGKMMRGIATTTTQIQAKYYDNVFVPANGERYVLEGVLELV